MSTDTILTPEEIGRIAVAHGCDPELDDGALVMRLCRAIEQAVLQSPEVQAWKKDAERYRSASKPESDGAVDICICRVNWETGTKEVLTGDRAHTAIDAAMEKQP